METKIIKIILGIAGLCLVFLIVSSFFISQEEGGDFMLIPAIPVIMAIVILVALGRSRYDTILPSYLRIVGIILFMLWILSFLFENPFRS